MTRSGVNILTICLAITASVDGRAAEETFTIQRWIASVAPKSINQINERLPLGAPVYMSPAKFVQLGWTSSSGADLLTYSPLAIGFGASTGTDDYAQTHLTNRTAQLYPIPTNQAGLYWRFTAQKTKWPITLDCAFSYNYPETNKTGQVITRKARYNGKLSFTNNEVAVIRLPTLNYETAAPRTILGFSFGQKKELETRELYIALSLTNPPAKISTAR
jgi:hypothetical protein